MVQKSVKEAKIWDLDFDEVSAGFLVLISELKSTLTRVFIVPTNTLVNNMTAASNGISKVLHFG